MTDSDSDCDSDCNLQSKKSEAAAADHAGGSAAAGMAGMAGKDKRDNDNVDDSHDNDNDMSTGSSGEDRKDEKDKMSSSSVGSSSVGSSVSSATDGFIEWNHERRREVTSNSNINSDSDSDSGSESNKNSNQNQSGHGRPRRLRSSDTFKTTNANVTDNDNVTAHNYSSNAVWGSYNDNQQQQQQQHDNNSYPSDSSSDSDTSSSSSCSSTESNVEWSISVRLNSVVDLPSSILPSVPLCPLLKFGLLTIRPDTRENQRLLQEIEIGAMKQRRADIERKNDNAFAKKKAMRGRNHVLPGAADGSGSASRSGNDNHDNHQNNIEQSETSSKNTNDRNTNNNNNNSSSNNFDIDRLHGPQTSLRLADSGGKPSILKDFQNNTSLVETCNRLHLQSQPIKSHSPNKSSSSNSDNDNDNAAVHNTLTTATATASASTATVKYTSGKIMSLKDNGMMEWHEDLRWDGIHNPLETVLAIELSARAVLPPSSSSHSSSNSTSASGSYPRGNGHSQSHAHAHAGGGGIHTHTGENDAVLVDMEHVQGSESQFHEKGRKGSATHSESTDGHPHPHTHTHMHTRTHSQMDYDNMYEKAMMSPRSNFFGSANDGSTNVTEVDSVAGSSIGGGANNVNNNNNANANAGIRGLLKWGRQSLAERRKRRTAANSNHNANHNATSTSTTGSRSMTMSMSMSSNASLASTNEYENANKAAAMARHLMDSSNHSNRTPTVGFHSNRDELKHGSGAAGIGGDRISNSAMAETGTGKDAKSQNSYMANSSLADGDLRLGTLLIPISNLPLEDSVPRVERWYQFDTVGNGNRTQEEAKAEMDGGMTTTTTTTSPSPKPWRDPTVLLDISLCMSQVMDELEDETYAVMGGGDESTGGMDGTGAVTGNGTGTGAGTGTGGAVGEEKGNPTQAPKRKSVLAKLNSSGINTNTTLNESMARAAEEVAENETYLKDFTSDVSHGTYQTHQNSNAGSGSHGSSQQSHSAQTQQSKRQRKISFDATHSSAEANELKAREEEEKRIKLNGPYLEPGIVDFISVVGAKNIGTQAKGTQDVKGWVSSEPDCCVLEQFPSNEFHKSNGRSCVLPEGIEGWCFPEGCRLWRGSEPPSHMDMNLKRFSASSPPRMASSIAAFDACLNCTTSFMWWVLSSNSDEYGSSISKTYGAVIRFYAEVPEAEKIKSGESLDGEESKDYMEHRMDTASTNKLWCPLGICLTCRLPIVGILEAVLLRLCEKLASTGGVKSIGGTKSIIHTDIMNLILNYQRPIPGVVNCSIPFLSGDGDRLHVSLPPVGGLPPLPHGVSITSVCRLLGAEGLTALLAAVLTECKILVHSADVGNLAMVGEVITALTYPFHWQLPYIPVLPLSMITFVEAPVSYFIGVPSCNMKWIDREMLIDVVVIDLDNGFNSSDYFDGRRGTHTSQAPTPLPATVSSNISKAIFRLLREEEEVQEQYGSSGFSASRHLPRLETESLPERDFRVAVAHQICGLIRGYQECLFFVSASTPVFNRDRFLRQAPALFEERRTSLSGIASSSSAVSASNSIVTGKIISPRSKRFLSGLVNSQHFHALLETLDSDVNAFFHEVMELFELQENDNDSNAKSWSYGSQKQRMAIAQLRNNLEIFEQKIPTYHVHNRHLDNLREEDEFDYDFVAGGYFSTFTSSMLQPVKSIFTEGEDRVKKSLPHRGSAMSLQDLIELEKMPWVYCKLFDIDVKSAEKTGLASSVLWKKIHLKEALGERKFNAWKDEQESKDNFGDMEAEAGGGNNTVLKRPLKSSLDLTKLISNVRSDEMANRNFVSKLKRGSLADRAVIRRYIERAYEIVPQLKEGRLNQNYIAEQFSDLNTEVDAAMKNPSAQRFLMSVLSQRSRLQNEHRKVENNAALRPGYNIEVSTSNLHPLVFDCLYRLCNSMLEACHHEYDYEAAYRLLIHTTGFCTANDDMVVSYMTKQISSHPIYADLRLWDRVLLIHQHDRQREQNGPDVKSPSAESTENDDYEATVSTLYEMLGYGMSADDLARFASRIAEEKFYSTDKEQKLLMLARRLAVKCDEATPENDLLAYDSEEIDNENSLKVDFGRRNSSSSLVEADTATRWEELTWTHPGSSKTTNTSISGYSQQCPITSLASFGSSIVATGALDGSIYLASTLHLDLEKRGKIASQFVRGRSLRWPSNPKLPSVVGTQDECYSGAVSCLAVARCSSQNRRDSYASEFLSDRDSCLASISDCRLIGGTTGGNLAVWTVSDALEDVILGERGEDMDGLSQAVSEVGIHVHSGGTQSGHVNVRGSVSPNSRSKRGKRARKGKSLGGHRGGVTCLSVPSQIYRPDSLISGGNDGLIKFWSLREDEIVSSRRNRRATMGGKTSRLLFSSNQKSSSKDTLDVLAGHGGRILCVETAWHGDRLLSGATDRTVKLWDLASQSRGRSCLQTMHGHTGWVTHGRYWGRNTIVSASSDRSIALWDTRSGNVPMFVLRHHNGPISDLYLESKTSFWMTSAGADGTVATWDFRMMQNLNDAKNGSATVTATAANHSTTNTMREPLASMVHGNQSSGPVLLGRGVGTKYGQGERSIMSVSLDNKIKEWDALNGNLLKEHELSFSNKISCFKTFTSSESLLREGDGVGVRGGKEGGKGCKLGGTITASWDGTVKLRQLYVNQ